MTKEEFAKRLIDRFRTFEMYDADVKRCAIIHCDMMIKELENLPKVENAGFYKDNQYDRINFYKQVKEIIGR